jgi:hypothetical protein
MTIGFDSAVNIEEVARVLASHFGNADVGRGISENGLPFGCIHIANKKSKKNVR